MRVATNNAPSLRPPDSRLLPPTPQRTGAKTVAVSNTAANVVSEFGLQVQYLEKLITPFLTIIHMYRIAGIFRG